MPKLIENLRETILQNAKAELLQKGYNALTIRSVAKDSHIAVGTMYNYFSSKELLAATVILEDWKIALFHMRERCARANTLSEALTALYEDVCAFSGTYQSVWAGYSFSDSERTAFNSRHRMLVRQLADCVLPVLDRLSIDPVDGLAVFLAENVLICAGDSELRFDAFLRIAERILQ